MLITCPSCASAFRIDIDRLGPEGRSVRCGACREPWFVSPAEVVAAQAEEIGAGAASMPDPAAEMAAIDPELAAWLAADPEPMRPEGDVVENIPPAPGRPAKALGKARAGTAMPSARRGLAGLSPATAAGLAILAALPLACLARVPVVRALPQTAGLYARIGLPVNLRGLELRDVVAYRNPADPSRPAELIIEGDLVGIAPRWLARAGPGSGAARHGRPHAAGLSGPGAPPRPRRGRERPLPRPLPRSSRSRPVRRAAIRRGREGRFFRS